MAEHLESDKTKSDIEREKNDIERRKLKLEWFKAWTGVPLLTLAATVFLTVWGQVQKARDDFALKAAEIVMNATGPRAAANKADALKQIFHDRLPPQFAESFDPEKLRWKGTDAMNKAELLRLLAEKSENSGEIISFWKALFPSDPALASFHQAYSSNPSPRKK